MSSFSKFYGSPIAYYNSWSAKTFSKTTGQCHPEAAPLALDAAALTLLSAFASPLLAYYSKEENHPKFSS